MRHRDVAREIVGALRTLSRHRLGAIVLVEPIGTVEDGVVLDAIVNRELLVALATPESINRIHRGAVVIRAGRVERAGVPLSWADVVERAAELAAGVAIEVDEDTGEVRMVNATGRIEVVALDDLGDALRRGRR